MKKLAIMVGALVVGSMAYAKDCPFLKANSSSVPYSFDTCSDLLKKGKTALLSSLNSHNNDKEFDDAQDFLEEAYGIAKSQLSDFETMVTLQYLVILSAIQTSRQGHHKKYRFDALDRLEVAHEQLSGFLHNHFLTDSAKITNYKQYAEIVRALSLLMEIALYLGLQEKAYHNARKYFVLARQTAHELGT